MSCLVTEQELSTRRPKRLSSAPRDLSRRSHRKGICWGFINGKTCWWQYAFRTPAPGTIVWFVAGTVAFLACSAPMSANESLAIPHVEIAVDGNPSTALPTSDGRFVFVSVTNVGGPNYSTPDVEAGKRRGVVSGVDILRRFNDSLQFVRFVPIGGRGANGMVFLRGEKTIAIAAGDEGVVFWTFKRQSTVTPDRILHPRVPEPDFGTSSPRQTASTFLQPMNTASFNYSEETSAWLPLRLIRKAILRADG